MKTASYNIAVDAKIIPRQLHLTIIGCRSGLIEQQHLVCGCWSSFRPQSGIWLAYLGVVEQTKIAVQLLLWGVPVCGGRFRFLGKDSLLYFVEMVRRLLGWQTS